MNPRPLHPEPVGRRGFSLVELLVVVSIMLVLMALVGGGVSAARGSQKRQATQSLITKLDAVLDQQFATYASRSVPQPSDANNDGQPDYPWGCTKATYRATYLRRLASAEMPDSWADVRKIVDGSSGLPLTAPQNAYKSVYQSLNPTDQYSDAECLFMIVMQGGIADCLECGELKSSDKNDTDGDGAFEFIDDYGKPIHYVLWPAALQLPPGAGNFFSTTPPFSAGTPQFAKGGTMRPLIYSNGPDGLDDIGVNASGNLAANAQCGDPTGSPVGGAIGGGAADNITNLDAEAAK
jgi:prepilin-type N-terminal cleavage/methylation domain-containing protein